MLKKVITFEDLDGNEVKEVFYFHLSETELTKIRMQYEQEGGMEQYFAKILKERNAGAITSAFDNFILGSIGKRSDDNKRFLKENGKIAEEFKETDAYSVLFQELLGNDGKNFQAFIQGVIPNRSKNRFDEELEKQGALNDRVATATAEIQQRDAVVKLDELVAKQEAERKKANVEGVPPFIRENRAPTKEELLLMTPEQIRQAFNK